MAKSEADYLEYHGSVAKRIIRELNEKSERLLAQAKLLARMLRKEAEVESDKEIVGEVDSPSF